MSNKSARITYNSGEESSDIEEAKESTELILDNEVVEPNQIPSKTSEKPDQKEMNKSKHVCPHCKKSYTQPSSLRTHINGGRCPVIQENYKKDLEALKQKHLEYEKKLARKPRKKAEPMPSGVEIETPRRAKKVAKKIIDKKKLAKKIIVISESESEESESESESEEDIPVRKPVINNVVRKQANRPMFNIRF